MDLYIELCKAFCLTIVTLVLAIVVWRKLPSKKDLERGLNILRADMIRLSDNTDAKIQAVHDKMDENFRTVHDKMEENFRTVYDKMDENFRAVYDKMDENFQKTHERIDNATMELRSDIKVMNQNHIDHLARHEEQALKLRGTQRD